MADTSTVDDQLIAGLARDQIAQMAPQELPLFRAQSQAYFSDPTKALQRRKPKEDMLGFGAEAAVTFLTPVVLEVTRSVIVYLVGEIEKTAKTESADVVHNLVRQLFKKFAPAGGGNATPGTPGTQGTQPAALTAAQLAEVRRLAFEKARQLNLAESQANLLADSMVGSLAIAST